jgi:hypothetical protein
MIPVIVRFINVILAALLAGVSFGIWMGFDPSVLSPAAFLEQQQNMVDSLQGLMIALVFLATAVTGFSAYMQRTNKPEFFALLLAAGFFIACILITRFGNKPIDDVVLRWTMDTMPNDWTGLRDRWWTLHIARTITELIALCLVVWTSIRKD